MGGEEAGSPPAKRPRLDNDAEEAERKKRERAEKFRQLRDAKKRKEAEAPPPPAATTTTTTPQQQQPQQQQQSSSISKLAEVPPIPAVAASPHAAMKKPFSRISVNLRMDATGVSEAPSAAATSSCRDAFSAQEALFQELLPQDAAAAPSSGVEGASLTAPTAASDSLDEYMQKVDKKYRSDVVDTLERMARTRRREERTAAATEAARVQALPKQSITLDEILEQGGESDHQEVDMGSFMNALREHEQKVEEPSSTAPSSQTAATASPSAAAQQQTRFLAIKADGEENDDGNGRNGGAAAAANGDEASQNDSILLGVDDDENQQGAIDDFLSAPGEPEASYFDLLAVSHLEVWTTHWNIALSLSLRSNMAQRKNFKRWIIVPSSMMTLPKIYIYKFERSVK